MDSESNWPTLSFGSWSDHVRDAAEHLPGVLGAMLLLVLGWIIARIVRHAVRGFANASNRFLKNNFPLGPMATVRVSPLMITLLGEVVFWVVALIAVTLALRIAGFGMVAQWLDSMTVYVPNLMAASIVLMIGVLFSVFVREQMSPKDGVLETSPQRARMALFAQLLVIAIALIVSLDQLGIEVGLFIALTVVGIAGVTFTLGATIALGSRQYTANLVGIRSARTQLRPGQWLRVDDIEGQILELSTTQVVLDTAQGKVLLPGHFLDARVAIILDRDNNQEAANG